MKVIKTLIITVVAITMALTLILTTKSPGHSPPEPSPPHPSKPATAKTASRFLQQGERNPRAADHCREDNEICSQILAGRNATCCNNKCMDLWYDDNNCGACKRKCAFTETCCRGECVNLAFDKRHCGFCNNRCMTTPRQRGYCIYGTCDYA